MAAKAPNLIASGIEPVDKLLGGLETGQLYLVHGDASGKSLFGIKFLIEGLKRGENGALVIRYSPEDAVRRFARLGYDCLEDVYSGRLVILEYSNEIIQQIARLRALAPVLRELEWLLGETRPQRLVFDPVTHLVVGEHGDLESRVQEFAAWARSFDATVTLVANCENDDVIRDFQPLVRESFRFEVKDNEERATRFLLFDKSPSIPEQPIEVDPSRGVFLLARGHATAKSTMAPDPSGPPPVTAYTDLLYTAPMVNAGSAASDVPEPIKNEAFPNSGDENEPLADLWLSRDGADAGFNESGSSVPEAPPQEQSGETNGNHDTLGVAEGWPAGRIPDNVPLTEGRPDLLSDLLDDLAGAPSALDLTSLGTEFFELDVARQRIDPTPFIAGADTADTATPADSSSRGSESTTDKANQHPVPSSDVSGSNEETLEAPGRTAARLERRHPSTRGDSSSLLSAHTVELLLRPPDAAGEMIEPMAVERLSRTTETAAAEIPALDPREFNVLVIDDDAASCELISQALGEYTVETVHDGISGLARLISFKPDLVILNVDLPIIDGFKILAHIRTSLNMPIIIVSGSRVRASDRLLSTELGADYYLTKPFSVKELRHKAKQLIARHRGISSWIVNKPSGGGAKNPAATESESQDRRGARAAVPHADTGSREDYFIPYADFVARVEKGVKAAIDSGVSFSIVGCRVPQMTTAAGRSAISLLELVRALIRETDVISTNPRNDIVVLLADAEALGARAFAGRLRDRISRELKQEPSVWVRSFPDLEEKTDRNQNEATGSDSDLSSPASGGSPPDPSGQSEPRSFYTDFLERNA